MDSTAKKQKEIISNGVDANDEVVWLDTKDYSFTSPTPYAQCKTSRYNHQDEPPTRSRSQSPLPQAGPALNARSL